MRLLSAVLFAAALNAGEPNHIVRVVSVTQADLTRGPKLFEETMARLESAASFRPDIAVLPELAIEGPNPDTKRLAAWAKRNSSYLIYGITTQREGKSYNSAVLLDRKGNAVGHYDKMHPTENELKAGTMPGEADQPVFETDFGIIGIQICFDVNWWNSWSRLKQKGAKIVFFPSAYPAARQIAALALANQFFVVTSAQSRSSNIYGIVGDTIATTGRYQPYAAAALPIGRRLFEVDFNHPKARAIMQKYGPKVEVVWHHDDDWFTLASLAPDLTVDELIAEYGLTPLDEYRVRAKKAVDQARQR
jgi:predicted amidohydrolase